LSQFRVVHLGAVFACCVLLCTLALAADQKPPTKLSDLPPEAEQAISAALARELPGVPHFTLTASDGANGDSFGVSAAIDGNTVVVGAAVSGNQEKGAVYVFVKPANGWRNLTQTAKLTSSDAQPLDQFGRTVAVSGNTVVVGASEATINGNPDQGAAYVFVKPAGGWTNMTQTAKLTAADGDSYSQFGIATAISGDNVVVGAPLSNGDNPAPGVAYIFVQPQNGWKDMTQTAELTASDSTEYDEFGASVSISGNTLIVGAPEDGCSCNAGPGAAYVFVEPPSGWANATETAKLTASDGIVNELFGWSVSLNNKTAVVGALGTAYVFVEPFGGWDNMTQIAELTNAEGGDGFGIPVSISGNVILVGDPGIQGLTGRAFAFLKPASGWKNTSQYNLQLGISFPNKDDMFGSSLAISGTTGVVGAPYAPTSQPCKGGQCAPGPGEAFVFTAK
jgi:FG-GAP repeat